MSKKRAKANRTSPRNETAPDEAQVLQARLAQSVRQLTALHDIGRALAATLDPREVCWVMYREIAQGLLGASVLFVALYDSQTQMIHGGFGIVDDQEVDPATLPSIPLGEGPVSDTIRTRQSRIVDLEEVMRQLKASGRGVQVGDERQPKSALYVPMISRDQIIGVVQVQHYAANAFRETDMALMSILASQAAIAIENARLFQAERAQHVLSDALRDTASALSSTLNFDEILDRMLANVGRVAPHDFADVMLVEGDVARVVRRQDSARHVLDAALPLLRIVVADTPHLRQIAHTGKPLVIADTLTYESWINPVPESEARSYAGAPIRLKGLLVGFLNLYSLTPGFFADVQAARLQAFADQAAVAIENAHLYGAMQRYADELEQRVAERTRELAEANKQLREVDRLKDQFISNVSHELRTPLSNVKLYLGLLEHGRSEKREQYLQTLNRESTRLATLIEDLLELSRLDLGAAHIHLEPTDLNALAAELIGDRLAMAADRGLTLDCQIDPALPPALADPRRVTQVMANLVANAVNYTPPPGLITIVTALRCEDGRNWVTFTVQDSGPGISAEDQPHLFERFFRGGAGRASGTPGSGLGLSICKELVEKMNGRIMLDSVPGRGAAFTVWLTPADHEHA